MPANSLSPGSVIRGPMFPEPVEILATASFGSSVKVIGRGLNSGMTHDPVLTPSQLAQLIISADREPFDGDARMFRLGVEAQRLGLAYEYDPFFSLSIARVDPLPYQLEAVYDYFMRLPRIRFLLADDPGAGKTIMAGLLLKELKARGLVKRVLIVTPANLTFQWQREMADKFRERFEVIRGDVLRANYGQEKDCLIFNFVARNTREGRVLRKLLDRLAEIRNDLGSDQVFDVVGEVFPANQFERMLREMYARQIDVHKIEDRIVRDLSPERFREITESTLEGLAKKELNLSAMLGKSAEAKERRLVPEVIEKFFVEAAPECGVRSKETAKASHIYRLGKVPRNLLPIGDRQEDRFGRLGREYKQIAFDKTCLRDDPTLDWVTPGHPLFEAVRTDLLSRTEEHLRKGAVFYDLHRNDPALIDVFAASIKDGRGRTLHRRLFAVETALSGEMKLHEPTVLLDTAAAPDGAPGPADSVTLPDRRTVEQFLYEQALVPWIDRAAREQRHEIERIRRHVEISLHSLIDRANFQQAEYVSRQIEGQTVPGLDGLIAQAEQHLDELNNRLGSRKQELQLKAHCAISDITHLGRAWVAPHPERSSPNIAPMVRDDEIERIAVQAAIEHEEARGWVVESVESDNRGFDLISRHPHPADPKTFIEVRFIEVKGRAGVGVVALSENEYRTAERLKRDYWLYVVFNCAGTPELHIVQNPARLGWQPVITVEHYQLAPQAILSAEE